MSEEQITKSYYSDKNITNFYLSLWGGDSIHIGIYPENYKYSKNENKDIKLKQIKSAIDNKKKYICNFIKMYYRGTYNIADFGSGYGGTARYLYDNLFSKYYEIKDSIDCYDISHDNCIINTFKNINNNYNIPVYNISFLNIPFSKKYNIIYSEDSFIHINNRDLIFKEINKKMLVDGCLIFSDIILTDNCNHNEIQEVYKRVNISNLETHSSYIEKAREYNLVYINSLEYKDSMLYHYKNIRDVIDENENNTKIIDGLDNWIKHIELGNITTKIFIFKKN
jgi:SAM-dependent methyltransferase